MYAVAVGGFDEYVVGLVKDGRVSQDGFVAAPDVTGKQDGCGLAVIMDFGFYHRGAEDVSGVVKGCLDSVGDFDEFFVSYR